MEVRERRSMPVARLTGGRDEVMLSNDCDVVIASKKRVHCVPQARSPLDDTEWTAYLRV
jgi:hypothetical protein